MQIRPGFALFMLLIIVINGVPMGPWLAGSVAAFTLIHELGHAIAARQTGATAQISLDFLAGYASFAPTRPLKRWERAGISMAGPFVQIALGCIVLLVLGVNPIDHDQFAADYWSFAIWWAGPAIGLFNLIPVTVKILLFQAEFLQLRSEQLDNLGFGAATSSPFVPVCHLLLQPLLA